MTPRPRTIVYVDGFNLYYGAVKNTPYKWLNLDRYFTRLRPGDDIVSVKYFTAEIVGGTKPNQVVFLKALSTLPRVQIILGRFKNKRIKCAVAMCQSLNPLDRFFEKPEEKRTDVNIAVNMLDDAYQNLCDQFVLVSGDSDLVPAVRMIRDRFPDKKVIVYIPTQNPVRGAAVELRGVAHKHRELPLNLLQHCQFPTNVPDGAGGFYVKPTSW